MAQLTMDSSLAAFMFALVYGPNGWLILKIWSGIDHRLEIALAQARKVFYEQTLPLCAIFKPFDQQTPIETHIRIGLENYFSGSTTVDLSRPLHLLLSTPVFVWGAVAIGKSQMWDQGTLPLSDFRTIFAGACLWFLISTGVFFMQFWGLRKVARSTLKLRKL